MYIHNYYYTLTQVEGTLDGKPRVAKSRLCNWFKINSLSYWKWTTEQFQNKLRSILDVHDRTSNKKKNVNTYNVYWGYIKGLVCIWSPTKQNVGALWFFKIIRTHDTLRLSNCVIEWTTNTFNLALGLFLKKAQRVCQPWEVIFKFIFYRPAIVLIKLQSFQCF